MWSVSQMVIHLVHNEHHITRRLSCIKPRATSEANENSHSYNLRPRKTVKHVHWLDCPAEVNQGKLNYQQTG